MANVLAIFVLTLPLASFGINALKVSSGKEAQNHTYVTPSPLTNDLEPANFTLLLKLSNEKLGNISESHRDAAYRPGRPSKTWECYHVTAVPYNVRRALGLSSFYRKYLHAYGIPILSSGRVNDAALRRACYVLVFLLADRKDIRYYLFTRNGRAGVIGAREGVTSIPEHSWLGPHWNQRARGLGGTIRHPISTGGEENLLCWSNDRYRSEDIFLHEFTHGIHEIAVAAGGAIRSFDGRLRNRYNYLRRTGRLWANTYAMSTDREYFAEGTQSFFGVNAEANPPNGVHNHVNTRAELAAYDPTLYNFVREVFPCGNRYLKRCDAVRGVQPYHFKMNCNRYGQGVLMDFKTKRPVGQPKTTLKPTAPDTPPKPETQPNPDLSTPRKPVTSSKPPQTRPPRPQTRPPARCIDRNPQCRRWAYYGECRKNPLYMNSNCRKSCGLCGTRCRDSHRSCRYWARIGECRRNPSYMSRICRQSCRKC